MDFEQAVFSRRSIRAFTGQDVTKDQVLRLIAYGHCAPSGGNLKEWCFIVVRSGEGKQRLAEATYSGNKETNAPQQWLKTAPVIIAVAADHRPVMKRYGRKGLDELLYLDCASAVENMLLGAVHLGLSSCFISGFREHEMAEALGLPEYMQPIALLPVGYAAGPGVLRPTVPPEEVTYYETYEAKHV
jgi:nitroreductase